MAVLLPVKEARADWLAQSIASVQAQTYRDFELWVIEAASMQPAAPVLLKVGDHRMRHIVLSESVTFVDQLNEGLRRITAPYVARMDADDLCRPRRLEAQLDFLTTHPEVDVVGCQLNVIDGAGRDIGVRSYPCEPRAVAAALRRYNALPHPGVMFRRQTVMEAGGYRFPERPAQDYELWSRLVKAGHNLANLDEVLLDYRLHSAAIKSRRLHETLKATLAVKQLHWREQMTVTDWLRVTAETTALALPGPVVHWIFTTTQVRPPR